MYTHTLTLTHIYTHTHTHDTSTEGNYIRELEVGGQKPC